MRFQYRCQRKKRGETIISLLVASLLIGFVTLELVQLLTLYATQGNFLWSRLDNLNSVTYALYMMGVRFRAARNVGDIYGEVLPPTAGLGTLSGGPSLPPTDYNPSNLNASAVQSGTATLVSTKFPSPGDPLYGPSAYSPYARAVTSWPWGGGPNSPYSLSPQTLIIQIPAFDTNGFPLALPPSYSGGPYIAAVDTYVYNLVASTDPTRAGTWDLQLAYFPTMSGLTNVPSTISPGTTTTIATGIVGPVPAGSPAGTTPSVFQYIEKNTNAITSATAQPVDTDTQNYAGVAVNLEVINKDARGQTSIIPIRTEMYMRNNVSATTIGGVNTAN